MSATTAGAAHQYRQYRDLWDRIDPNAASSSSDLFQFLTTAGTSCPLSAGQTVMLKLLLDLVNQTGHCYVRDMLWILDDDNWEAALRAMREAR